MNFGAQFLIQNSKLRILKKIFLLSKNGKKSEKNFFSPLLLAQNGRKEQRVDPMQSENGISNWNLKIQKNPKITKSREKNPKFFFHPKYGLWGLKSKGIARAFISSAKISRFLAILAFSYRGRVFFQLFCYFTQSMACDSSNRSESRGRSSRTIKFHDFWLFCLFPIFIQMALLFVTFWLFLCKTAFFFLSRQTNDNFGKTF